MKEILNSRKTAAAVLAAVILVFTPIGAIRSLNSVADSVEAMFTDGVKITENGSSYTSASIENLLIDVNHNALGLITIGSGCSEASEETAALRSAREELLSAGTISEMYSAYEKMGDAEAVLYEKLKASDISSSDSANADEYYRLLTDIRGSIALNRYNDKVSEFYDVTLSLFPANLFASLVSGPEYFGE